MAQGFENSVPFNLIQPHAQSGNREENKNMELLRRFQRHSLLGDWGGF